MSRRERDTRVRLGGMTGRQVEFVRDAVVGDLIARADDLRLLHKHPDPRREISEVSALARLAFWLEDGEILVPDRAARRVAERLAEEVDATNDWEEVVGRYEEAMAEHEAMHAFVANFPDRGVETDR